MNRSLIAAALLSLVASQGSAGAAPGALAFDVDAANSSLEVDVYRGGFLAAFGHDHLIAAKEFSGRILLDRERVENSSVILRINSRSLAVIDPDVSDLDRVKVQSTMRSERVLDVAKYPEIVFISTGVTRTYESADAWTLTVKGRLSLRGVEREAALPVILRLSGAELLGEGEIALKQSDYGIETVKVAGGLVKVKDSLRIRFRISARGAAP